MNKSIANFIKKNSDKVKSVSDERDSNDGIWVYLLAGWVDDDNQDCLHGDTLAELNKLMGIVRRCG